MKHQVYHIASADPISTWRNSYDSWLSIDTRSGVPRKVVYASFVRKAAEYMAVALDSGLTGPDLAMAITIRMQADGLSNYSIRYYLGRIIGPFLVYAGFITDSYRRAWVRQIPAPYRTLWSEKALSSTDLTRFLLAAREPTNKDPFTHTRRMCQIGLYMAFGVRSKALVMLMRDDVRIVHDRNHSPILSVTFVRLKKNSAKEHPTMVRTAPLPMPMPDGTTLADWVLPWLETRNPKSERFFHTKTGMPISQYQAHLDIHNVGKKVGLHIGPHTLRHTVGTIVADKHGIYAASTVLDHSSIIHTQLYLKPKVVLDSSQYVSDIYASISHSCQNHNENAPSSPPYLGLPDSNRINSPTDDGC